MFVSFLSQKMSGIRGGRRGGGRTGGRNGGGGRGGVNLTQEDLNTLLQAAFQAGHNAHGGELILSVLPRCEHGILLLWFSYVFRFRRCC